MSLAVSDKHIPEWQSISCNLQDWCLVCWEAIHLVWSPDSCITAAQCTKNYQNIVQKQFDKVIAKIKGCNFFCHTVYTSYTAQPVAQYTTCTLSLIHLNIFLSHISNCNKTSCAKQPKARGPSTLSQCSPIKMNTGIDAVAIMQMLTADDMNMKSKSKYKRRGSHSECQNCNNSYDRNLCCPVIQYVQLQWSC